MLEINLLDIVVVIILLAFFARGLLRGLTREVGGLVSIVGGFALARHFQPQLQPHLETLFSNPDVAAIIAFLLVFFLVGFVVMLAAAGLRRFMTMAMTSWIDHILGGLAGLAKALLIMSLLFYLIQGFFPDLVLVKTAQATPLFNSLTDYLRNFLPEAFTYKLPTFRL